MTLGNEGIGVVDRYDTGIYQQLACTAKVQAEPAGRFALVHG